MLLTSTFTIPTYSLQHKWTLGRKNWIQAAHCKQNSHCFHRGAKAVPANKTQNKKFLISYLVFWAMWGNLLNHASVLSSLKQGSHYCLHRTHCYFLALTGPWIFLIYVTYMWSLAILCIAVRQCPLVRPWTKLICQAKSFVSKIHSAKQHQQIRKTQIWSLTHSWGTHLHREKVEIIVSRWAWSAERDFSILFKKRSERKSYF